MNLFVKHTPAYQIELTREELVVLSATIRHTLAARWLTKGSHEMMDRLHGLIQGRLEVEEDDRR